MGPAPAPDKTPYATGWGIGVSAGTTSAIGLSTRKHFANRWGVHLGGIYIFHDNLHFATVGAQALYTLARGRKTRLYGLLGTQFLLQHDVNQGPQNDLPGPQPDTSSNTRSTLFVGPGLGLEIHFTRHFGWALEVPATVVFALDGDEDRLPFGGPVNLIPAANTAFTFYFR